VTIRVLIGLILGFATGLAIAGRESFAIVPALVEPVGTIWINAIRMTVIPLVVASLIVGVASAPDTRTVGRLGGRAVLLFILIVFLSAVVGVVATPIALAGIHADPAAVAAMQATAPSAAGSASAIPTFSEWLVSLVPVNPVKSASDGAMLPLIVFSVLFGLSLTRIDASQRVRVVNGLRGIQDATFVLVRWVLIAAPIGVFALTVPLATRLGVGAAGAVALYIAVVSILCVLFMLLVLYPAASVFGRIPIARFARIAFPVQAVAMSSRSSMGSLPVMIEELGTRLRLPNSITGFLLPLSASVFRAGAGIGITGGACFLAALYGVDLTTPQLATIAVTTTLLSFSIPGIPAGSIIAMVPVLLAAGLPIEGVGILIGVDTIPDMFRTTANVTGSMTVAVILGKGANETTGEERG
jgi:Na+/H+-dicarboxylate symporter